MRRKYTVGCPCCGNPPDNCYVSCKPCQIPATDLVMDWVNPITGNGSRILAYNHQATWQTECVGGVVYKLECRGGRTIFSATVFSSAFCDSGDGQTCSSDGGGSTESLSEETGHAITKVSQRCYPYQIVYEVTSEDCPQLAALGYQKFTINAPEWWPKPGSDECIECFTCFCNHQINDRMTATYNGKTYVLTNGVHRISAGGGSGSVTGWLNDSPVPQPSDFGTVVHGVTCDPCSNVGDIPTRILVRYVPAIRDCIVSLEVPYSCNCPDVLHSCWNSADTIPILWYSITASKTSFNCENGRLTWSGTVPAILQPSIRCILATPPTPPGGGGTLTLSATLNRPRPQVCCRPCTIPKRDLTASLLFDTCPTKTVSLIRRESTTPGSSDIWESDSFVTCNGYTLKVQAGCYADNFYIYVYGVGVDNWLSCDSRTSNEATMIAATCSPFHIEYQMPAKPPFVPVSSCQQLRYYTGLKNLIIDE